MKMQQKNFTSTRQQFNRHRKTKSYFKVKLQPQISDKKSQSHHSQTKMNLTQNIFEFVKNNSAKSNTYFLKSQRQKKIKKYDICGNEQFKSKYFFNNQPIDFDQNKKQKSNSESKTFSQQNFMFKRTIYPNQQHHKKTFVKLSKDQQNQCTRQKRILQNYNQNQNTWRSIQKNLKQKMNKFSTVTFDSIIKTQRVDNPQKQELINDMIPQYWRNSLRNNNKKLQSYIRGNPFKKEIAQEMLQTLKGTRKLQNSIPKISFKLNNTLFQMPNEHIKLKGKSITKQDNNQTITMRSFYQDYNKKISQKIKQNQTIKPNKKKYQQFQLTNEEKQQYDFSNNLISLTQRIDKQTYCKNYLQKRKWLNQPYELNQ